MTRRKRKKTKGIIGKVNKCVIIASKASRGKRLRTLSRCLKKQFKF